MSLQTTQMLVVLCVLSLQEKDLLFLGSGAHCATAALLSICSLSFVLPNCSNSSICLTMVVSCRLQVYFRLLGIFSALIVPTRPQLCFASRKQV